MFPDMKMCSFVQDYEFNSNDYFSVFIFACVHSLTSK